MRASDFYFISHIFLISKDRATHYTHNYYVHGHMFIIIQPHESSQGVEKYRYFTTPRFMPFALTVFMRAYACIEIFFKSSVCRQKSVRAYLKIKDNFYHGQKYCVSYMIVHSIYRYGRCWCRENPRLTQSLPVQNNCTRTIKSIIRGLYTLCSIVVHSLETATLTHKHTNTRTHTHTHTHTRTNTHAHSTERAVSLNMVDNTAR